MKDVLTAIGAITSLLFLEIFLAGMAQMFRNRKKRKLQAKLSPAPPQPILQLMPMPADVVLVPNCVLLTYLTRPEGGLIRVSIASHRRADALAAFKYFFPEWSPMPVASDRGDPAPGELKLLFEKPQEHQS